MGIKKAGKSLNPISRPWTAHKEGFKYDARAEKQRGHQLKFLLCIKSVQILIKEEKPMRFQYVETNIQIGRAHV